jgi:3-oxoacyl-[acyl-carrier-protein] synthase I
MLLNGHHTWLIVAGVDSFLTAPTVIAYDEQRRLLKRGNSNAFIPGEAAAAVLLTAPTDGAASALSISGLGFAREAAPFGSGKPLRAEGLTQAIRAALAEADIQLKACDFRIADMNGEQYKFKEAALAVTRILRDQKMLFSLWHPADCIGEVGAATLPAMLAMLLAGAEKDYLPGPMLLGHLGNDDDKRGAFVAQAAGPQTLRLEETSAAERNARRRRAI